ncbi:MAG: DUF2256 domain-containing protein [Rhodopirellula sp. TMED11]|nr:MAG: DUF2256 domain-containing protein [Rhodopirellula sp. TMED11]
MARNNKTDSPRKLCAVCGRPFSWRKKWERSWDSVKYCSQRCRREKASGTPKATGSG